jgi:hypothetical protein
MQRFMGLVILLAAGIGVYFCITNVLWQDRAIRHFVAVPAQILTTEVRTHRGGKGGPTYSPEATYSYTYNGQQHQSTRVLAISYSTNNHAWAQDVLARIDGARGPRGPGGAWRSTAYVNPQNPEEAILVRDYSFLPYGFGMGTLLAAGVGAGMLAGVIGAGRGKMAAVALDDSGWQLLLPAVPVRRQYRNAVIWLIGGGIALLVMPAHWVLVAGQGGLTMFIAGAIALGVIASLGIVTFRRWSVCRHLSDARLRIKPAPMCRGEAFAMEVEIDAYAPLNVTEMNARLICTEHYKEKRGSKTYYGTRTRAEKTVELHGAGTVPAGEVVGGKGEVTFDRDMPPTTDITIKNYPYFTWELRLLLALEGTVDYTAIFPLEVD